MKRRRYALLSVEVRQTPGSGEFSNKEQAREAARLFDDACNSNSRIRIACEPRHFGVSRSLRLDDGPLAHRES
jgi:hypothetical protein